MFRLRLFANRGFSMGSTAALLTALSRGGLQFMLIIWLQGIWLPQHGYSFAETPLWAGIYLIPLTVGFFISGPVSGRLADRFGARPFATIGVTISAAAYLLFNLLPMNFGYVWFAVLLLVMGTSMGLFFAPNTSAVMNALPIDQRGAGAGMLNTFQNSASVMSMGIFFTIITLGLASALPSALGHGLAAQGVPAAQAHTVASLPPIGLLFAAFLGFNPIHQLLPSAAAAHVSTTHYAYLTGRGFFPSLIAGPFGQGLHAAFAVAAGLCLLAAVCSWLRGPGDSLGRRTSTEDGFAGAGEVAMEEVGAGGVTR